MAKRKRKTEDPLYVNEAGMMGLLDAVLIDNGFEVFKEVSTPHGYCDMVATKEVNGQTIRWAIEGKMQCNDKVIKQALDNREYFHYCSIVAPQAPNFIYADFLKRNGIGVLVLTKDNFFSEPPYDGLIQFKSHNPLRLPLFTNSDVSLPDYFNLSIKSPSVFNPHAKIDRVLLHELHKIETSGKKSGERITLYKLTVLKVQSYLAGKGFVCIDDILKDMVADLYWANPRQGIRNMCSVWEEEKFETKYEQRKTYIKNRDAV
jgi:hypothetical protein